MKQQFTVRQVTYKVASIEKLGELKNNDKVTMEGSDGTKVIFEPTAKAFQFKTTAIGDVSNNIVRTLVDKWYIGSKSMDIKVGDSVLIRVKEWPNQDEARRKKVGDFYLNQQKLMANLFSRWQDEFEMEDINDYAVQLKKEVEKIGGSFIKMTKKPFGFQFELDGAFYHIFISKRKYQYKRIS